MAAPGHARKERLDQALVARGMAESRSQAQALIYGGVVLVDGRPAAKPAALCGADAKLELRASPKYVSRGGLKLEHALERFALDVRGKVCLDIGASTGGFTDCLLQHGAKRVYAVDVGRGLLHWRLRNDQRVVLVEGINARYLAPELLPEKTDFACADVSFISLRLILPAVDTVLRTCADAVVLIKPQFEAGRSKVGRGGVVKDEAVRSRVVEEMRKFVETALNWKWLGVCPSPILGPAGNLEFLAWLRKPTK